MRAAFLWHFHQPLYRHPATGAFVLPWVRLHGTRAYYDMPRVLLEFDRVRAVFNLVPSLVAQVEAYAAGTARDVFLDLTARRPADLSQAERAFVIRHFFLVDSQTGIRPSPRYAELFARRGQPRSPADLETAARAFSNADLRDLQVHFNLAWFGFCAREDFPALGDLQTKDRDFTDADVEALLAVQREVVAAIVPGFRRAFDAGRAELTVSPYFHPILPLVIDTDSARRAMPQVALPPRFAWPEDARVQVERALDFAESRFGARPTGMWPPEGSVSPEAAALLAACGVRWFASDERVLAASLPAAERGPAALRTPWRIDADGRSIAAVFRNQDLSDRIGFRYAGRAPGDAARDLVDGLCAAGGDDPEALVTVALDGENPWERYPASGRDFLRALYRRLDDAARDGRFEVVRVRDHLEARPPSRRLPHLHSGSWIDANFRVWIGHAEDVAAWTMLGAARARFAELAASLPPDEGERAYQALLAAEGSDWTWWYGDDFATETAVEFDALFRAHLEAAYRALGDEPPPSVLAPIAAAARPARTAYLPPRSRIHPIVDGRVTSYLEWAGAGRLPVRPDAGSMHRGTAAFAALHVGVDERHLYLRLDPADPGRLGEAADEVRLHLSGATLGPVSVPLRPGPLQPARAGGAEPLGRGEFRDIVEIEIPFQSLGFCEGALAGLTVQVLWKGATVDRIPQTGEIPLALPPADVDRPVWTI